VWIRADSSVDIGAVDAAGAMNESCSCRGVMVRRVWMLGCA
jgi:hypothetical protein